MLPIPFSSIYAEITGHDYLGITDLWHRFPEITGSWNHYSSGLWESLASIS